MLTAQQLINRYDEDRENSIPTERKLKWLKRIELTVMSDVIYQYEHNNRRGIEQNKILFEDNDLDAYYDEENKVLDISEFPGMYVEDGVLTMTSYDPTEGESEAEHFGPETYLQIPEPYDAVYEHYLDMMIARSTGDTKGYNRAAELFNTSYLAFKKWYSRNHRSNRARMRLFPHEVL